MPRELDISKLSQFGPREQHRKPERASEGVPEPLRYRAPESSTQPWPSREPMVDGQISVKAPMETVNRFKRMCTDDRRTYADMLRILMDHFEK